MSVNNDNLDKNSYPTFHSSKVLAKVKSSDLGYINIAKFHPHQYQLTLTYPRNNILEAGINNKIICTIFTSELFNDKIQAVV